MSKLQRFQYWAVVTTFVVFILAILFIDGQKYNVDLGVLGTNSVMFWTMMVCVGVFVVIMTIVLSLEFLFKWIKR